MEMEPNEQMKKMMGPIFEKIHSYEILETLKIDLEECICIDLVEFIFKDGVPIERPIICGGHGNIERVEIRGSETYLPHQTS